MLWQEFRTREKKGEITRIGYIKKLKMIRTDLQQLGLVIQDELFCIALINGSRLDPVTKLNIELEMHLETIH